LSANSSSYSGAAGKERFILEGNARLRKGKTLITPTASRPTARATASPLHGKRDPFRREAAASRPPQRLDYDSELKLSRLQGPSVMEDKENKVVIKGSFIVNDETLDIIIIQVGVRILMDDMVCRSEYAIYRRGEDKLELTGLPVVVKAPTSFAPPASS
jgi:lipopolysaccharide export system protein LptA